jgi:GT2 family glycosyltransferase
MTHLENAPSPALSVVVPVFNAGERIAPLLRSLAEQTMSPERFEVVFVDDGSTRWDRRTAGRGGSRYQAPHSGGPHSSFRLGR